MNVVCGLCVFPVARYHPDGPHTKQGRLDETGLSRAVACYSVLALCGVGWLRSSVNSLHVLNQRNFRRVMFVVAVGR
jgi:hypothetical protein